LTEIVCDTGEPIRDPGTMNTTIALARAVDRLAKAMESNTQATRDFDQTVKNKEERPPPATPPDKPPPRRTW
jgi:hypothetical protein